MTSLVRGQDAEERIQVIRDLLVERRAYFDLVESESVGLFEPSDEQSLRFKKVRQDAGRVYRGRLVSGQGLVAATIRGVEIPGEERTDPVFLIWANGVGGVRESFIG